MPEQNSIQHAAAADDYRPLFPVPVRLVPTEEDPGPGLHSSYGYCAPWCWDTAGEGKGATVEDHGTKCSSRGQWADGIDGARRPVQLEVALMAPYTHGVYQTADVLPDRQLTDQVVGLTIVDHLEREGRSYLTPAEARRLAAGLIHQADIADGIAPALLPRDGRAGL